MKVLGIRDQVLRLGIALVILVIALIAARIQFVPPSFGEIGHYRADAITTNIEQPLRYAGGEVCGDCHEDETESKSASYHRTLSCEVCHGPAALHADDYEAQTPFVPRARGEACLECHEYLASRPTGFPQIIETRHNPLQPCIDCHDPHAPTPPDVPESCSACHAQIARTKAVSHHVSLECEVCHDAPAEHRTEPRSYLPKKPTSREFCGQCHGRGADRQTDAPRVDLATHGGRYLCWQCHYPHFPES